MALLGIGDLEALYRTHEPNHNRRLDTRVLALIGFDNTQQRRDPGEDDDKSRLDHARDVLFLALRL
jgi:hypothetical protein